MHELQTLGGQLGVFAALLEVNLFAGCFGFLAFDRCLHLLRRGIAVGMMFRQMASNGLDVVFGQYLALNGLAGVFVVLSLTEWQPGSTALTPVAVCIGVAVGVIGLVHPVPGWRDYREYEKRTNLRVWQWHVDGGSLAEVHRYYLGGRIRTVVDQRFGYAIVTASVVFLVQAVVEGAHRPFVAALGAIGPAVGAIAVLVVIRRLFLAVWSSVRPDLELMELCTSTALCSLDGTRRPTFRPAGWRNSAHRDSFRMAELIERCLSTMPRYFARDDMDKVSEAGRKIAESLRLNALRTGDDADAFQERMVLGVLLVTSEDPLRYVPPIMELTREQETPPDPARRRFSRLAEAMNSTITTYWSSIRILLLVAGIVLYLAFNRYTELAALLGK